MTITCAIELGSARIKAVAAERDESGRIHIRAVESIVSNSCIRHGYVHNYEDTAAKVKGLIQKLNNRLSSTVGSVTIEKAYICVAGMSIHTIPHTPLIHLDDSGIVTSDIVKKMMKESQEITLQGYDNLEVVPMYYELDGHAYFEATGGIGAELIAHHQIIVARTKLLDGIRRIMSRAGLTIAGYITQPIALAQLLTEEEKKRGCVLINWGAETTTIIIYKNQILRHIAVIPLGGESVTRDIMSQGFRHEKAEKTKVEWSSVVPDNKNDARPSIFEENVIGMEIPLLNTIVQYRVEEIIANLKHQISRSGLSTSQLEGGCIITGDAANQKGLNTLLSREFNLPVSVRAYSKNLAGGAEKRLRYAGILCCIEQCKENCAREKSETYNENIETTAPTQTITQQEQVNNRTKGADNQKEKEREVESPLLSKRSKKGINRFFEDLFSGLDD